MQALLGSLRRSDGSYDFSARGTHGQFVFVSPRNQVVIARNGRESDVHPQVWMRRFEGLADRLGADADSALEYVHPRSSKRNLPSR